MFSCYILYSKSVDKFYIGSSHTSLKDRVCKHNTSFYSGHHYTSQASDWELYLSISCESFSHARKIENHIKRMKSRKYITDLRLYPEILEKLLYTYARK